MRAKRAMKKLLLFPVLFPFVLLANWGSYDLVVNFPKYTGLKRLKEIFLLAWEDYWQCW